MFNFSMNSSNINNDDTEIEKNLTVTQKSYFIASWIKMQDKNDKECKKDIAIKIQRESLKTEYKIGKMLSSWIIL